MWTRELKSLTGIPAGQADDEGEFPEGTINYLVNENLDELTRRLKEYESPQGEEAKEEDPQED